MFPSSRTSMENLRATLCWWCHSSTSGFVVSVPWHLNSRWNTSLLLILSRHFSFPKHWLCLFVCLFIYMCVREICSVSPRKVYSMLYTEFYYSPQKRREPTKDQLWLYQSPTWWTNEFWAHQDEPQMPCGSLSCLLSFKLSLGFRFLWIWPGPLPYKLLWYLDYFWWIFMINVRSKLIYLNT